MNTFICRPFFHQLRESIVESDQHQMSRSKRGDMIASTKVGFIKRGKFPQQMPIL